VNTGIDGTQIFSGTETFSGEFSIKILQIDYDPEGADTDNETITLKLE
jgi:hypothetical protein